MLLNPLQYDSLLRIIGSVLVIVAHFITLHVSLMAGVTFHLIADMISVPYFIRTKAWDVVIMLAFLSTISVSKFLF